MLGPTSSRTNTICFRDEVDCQAGCNPTRQSSEILIQLLADLSGCHFAGPKITSPERAFKIPLSTFLRSGKICRNLILQMTCGIFTPQGFVAGIERINAEVSPITNSSSRIGQASEPQSHSTIAAWSEPAFHNSFECSFGSGQIMQNLEGLRWFISGLRPGR